MTMFSFQETEAYFKEHYFTLSQLAQKSKVAEKRIQEFISAGCIPDYSYEAQPTTLVCSHVFGKAHLPSGPTEYYYAPSVICWLEKAQKLASTMSLEDVAKTMKADFGSEFRQALLDLDGYHLGFQEHFKDPQTFHEEKIVTLIDKEWNHHLKGTYGVCTRQPTSARNMVCKEIAVNKLKILTDSGKKESLAETERRQLITALREFDTVATSFAPHDRVLSSRKRFFDDVIEKYGIAKEAFSGSK